MPLALSVVVPVKDEAENAAPLAREIAQALKGGLTQSLAHEIIFVDDGSTDGTAGKLTALRGEIPELRVLRHKRNLGQSRAVRSGVMAARGAIIGTLDGDGQNDPADLPRLLAEMQRLGTVAMVSGVRVKRQDNASRRMASRLGNGFRNWMLKDGAADTGCGIKVFQRDAYLELPYFDHQHRFLIALMRREGYGVGFLPVGHRPRLAGRSKYTNFGRMLVSINDLLGMRWLIKRHRGPAGTEEL
jgi:glycosyltransferase involved in cell wall biosynthesis